MKPERALIAERPLANHSPALVRTAPGAVELVPVLASACARLAAQLSRMLGPVAGMAEDLAVSAAPPRVVEDAPSGNPGGLSALVPLRLDSGDHAMLVLPGRAVLALLDRAFGGHGRVANPLPEALPVSADLLVDRIASAAAAAIHAALPEAKPPVPAGRAEAVAAGSHVTVDFTVTAGTADPWVLGLLVPEAALPEFLGSQRPATAGQRVAHGRADPLAEPFAAMPLDLRATLVDMRVPFSAIAGLAPGMMLPVAVARSIPLSIGGKTIAHGAIGALDDRVAIQVKDLSLS